MLPLFKPVLEKISEELLWYISIFTHILYDVKTHILYDDSVNERAAGEYWGILIIILTNYLMINLIYIVGYVPSRIFNSYQMESYYILAKNGMSER